MDAKEIFEKSHRKYIRPSSSLFINWCWKKLPHGRNENDDFKGQIEIQRLLDAGYKVKAGWTGSSMCRSFHETHVFWK